MSTAPATATLALKPDATGVFRAVDVHVGPLSITVAGSGATFERVATTGDAGTFTVGRRSTLKFPYLLHEAGPGDDDDAIEVDVATACGFLGLLRNLNWRATGGNAGFRALFDSADIITAAAIGDLAAAVPAPPMPSPAPVTPTPEKPPEPTDAAEPPLMPNSVEAFR